jgi:3-hydroxybutyryl-CoA dehydrogenase
MNLRDIQRIGVVGAGTMGHGIAINFALAGYRVLISDVSEAVLDEAQERIRAALDLFVGERLVSRQRADGAASLIAGTGLEELARQCDFVTEAIVDRSSDKRALFNRLDALCPPQTIFASNTSSLVLSDFGSDVKRQDKIVLTHYFAPPHIVPGVEVAKGPGTSDETYELTCELMTAARKVPIRLQKERPGYLLNTIQRALSQAATDLWAEGMASAEDIELGIISTFGFRMPHEGPMKHYDLAGLWRWPEDVRGSWASANEQMKQRLANGRPWFIDPSHFDEALEARDREYARRLKALYWRETLE